MMDKHILLRVSRIEYYQKHIRQLCLLKNFCFGSILVPYSLEFQPLNYKTFTAESSIHITQSQLI